MSNHLMDIATQQLVTIARTTAYHCDEQHEYMKGANGNDWHPHKWVVEAMRAAVTIRNTQAEDMVREELHQTRAQLAEAHALLREIEGCPWVVEEATIPKAGIEAAPQQVVGTMHIGLMRLRKIRALLSASAEPSEYLNSCKAIAESMAEPSAPVERDERAEFDAWCVKHGRVVGYCGWREDFSIWQARAALERKP